MQKNSNVNVTFEVELFQAILTILPKTTVRGMSRIMGKSEGYWSSVVAQGLPVSNDALCYLISYLETRKVTNSSTPEFNQQVTRVQRLISKEIVKRFNSEYWEYVYQVQEKAESADQLIKNTRSDPMPFIVSVY